MRRPIAGLAEGLIDILDPADIEPLGALLAPELVKAAKGALRKLEDLERDQDGPWSPEVLALQQALADAGVKP